MMMAIKSRTATCNTLEKIVAFHFCTHLRAISDFMKYKSVKFAEISWFYRQTAYKLFKLCITEVVRLCFQIQQAGNLFSDWTDMSILPKS